MSFYINNFRNYLQSKSQNIEQDYTEPVRLSETQQYQSLREAYEAGYRQALNEQGAPGPRLNPNVGHRDPNLGIRSGQGGTSKSFGPNNPGGIDNRKGRGKIDGIGDDGMGNDIWQSCDENGENCVWWCGTQWLVCNDQGCYWSESGCSEADGPCCSYANPNTCGNGSNPNNGGPWG